MAQPLSLTTLLPALRAITSIQKGDEPRQWIIVVNRTKLQAMKSSQESLVSLLQALNITITDQERGRLVLTLPTGDHFDDYIRTQRDELLEEFKPRFLTKEEIEDIVQSIPRVYSPFEDVAQQVREEILDRVRDQLSEAKYSPLAFPDLKAAIIERFERARVEAGETVGLTVAEALSALTQAALNAFHSTGSKTSIAAGIEMLQDLLAVRTERNFEACNIHFWDKNLTFEQVFNKRTELVEVTVGDVVEDFRNDAPNNFDTYWWVELYPQLTGKPLPKTSSVLQLILKKNVIFSHNITMEEIVRAIESYNTYSIITVIPGPLEEGLIFIYPDEELAIEPFQKKKVNITENVAETFINEILLPNLSKLPIKGLPKIKAITPVSSLTWSIVEEELPAASPQEIEEITDPRQRDEATRSWFLVLSSFRMIREGITVDKLVHLLEILGFIILDIQETLLIVISPTQAKPASIVATRIAESDQINEERREERIKAQQRRRKARLEGTELPNVPPVVVDIHHQIQTASRYVYATSEGSNLIALFGRSDIDTRRTVCNNPNVILRLLGIEAARNLLIQEFIFILENASLDLDPRHIILLVDFMTNRGVLLPISFWGVVRQNPGPLTVASFGKPLNIYRTAAGFGQSEKIRTAASSIYVGQKASIGSGYVDLRIDEEKIRRFQQELAQEEKTAQPEISASDLENAIQQIDTITFGATTAPAGGRNALARLATLQIEPPVLPTTLGEGTISPPVELTQSAPLVSKLFQKTMDATQITTTLPVEDTIITTTEQPSPNTPIALPSRPTVRLPVRRAAPIMTKATTPAPLPTKAAVIPRATISRPTPVTTTTTTPVVRPTIPRAKIIRK